MLIKKIKLNNIRSYKDQEVIFPEGSILLSGNIGSGKSTILLAMDFALFGISRDLPGTALLRNGEKEGSVELEFEVNDQNFSIKRGLKRGPTSVTQDTGHLIINGELTEMTAMELKQKIIETLNYPQELLTKSKSMIYHYTVYSPQEKMKEILLNKKEDRLGILRKVFGIDKYQRVRKNTEIFITSLKQKSKEIAVKIADLEQKSEELAERKERQSEITINIEGLNPQIIKFEELIKEKKVLTTSLEEQLKEILNSKHEAEKKRISLEHKKTDINQTTLELQRTNQEIELLEKELSELPIFDPSLQEKLNIIKQDLIKYEEQTIHLEKKKSELETKKSSHQKLSDDINQMDHCPVCDQNVDENHKHSVSAKESKEIGRLDEELRAIKKGLVDNQSYLEEKTKEKAKIEQDIQKQSIVHLKQKDFENKKLSLSNFSQKVQNTKLEISKISQEIIEIEEKTKDNPHLEEKIKSQRTE
ncbi:SMC family ATPase [Candidatus Woesearchaeota archaeon]|nr:SMC family ATPase [Candidatus Woesearchaeota archaeon]